MCSAVKFKGIAISPKNSTVPSRHIKRKKRVAILNSYQPEITSTEKFIKAQFKG
jgi:hypothetical protein